MRGSIARSSARRSSVRRATRRARRSRGRPRPCRCLALRAARPDSPPHLRRAEARRRPAADRCFTLPRRRTCSDGVGYERPMMRSLIALLALVPLGLAAQDPTPTPPAAAPSQPTAIDRVVAVVGTEPILLSEIEGIAQQIMLQRRQPYPTDSAARAALLRETLDEYIDVRVVVAAAKAAKVEIDEAQLAQSADARIAQIRRQFS